MADQFVANVESSVTPSLIRANPKRRPEAFTCAQSTVPEYRLTSTPGVTVPPAQTMIGSFTPTTLSSGTSEAQPAAAHAAQMTPTTESPDPNRCSPRRPRSAMGRNVTQEVQRVQ